MDFLIVSKTLKYEIEAGCSFVFIAGHLWNR